METRGFSTFNSIDEYEQYQKQRILQVVLITTSIVVLPLIYLNYVIGAFQAVAALVGLLIICLVSLVLNSRNAYVLAAVLFSLAVYLAVFFNLLDGGGLRDSGIVTLPVITVFASLLFSRRVSILFTGLSSLMVVGFHVLQGMGIIQNPNRVGVPTIITILVLLVVTNVLQISVLRVWMRNMEWVLYSEGQMKQAYDNTLEGWAKALEYRDRETEGHSRRVVTLSVALARAMGIEDQEKLQQITRGALLHDIGKMAIPDNILLKNDSLTEEEWVVIKEHPVLAEEMMSDIAFLSSAMEIPCYHHERWDGSGYPTGLAGENIPLAARIFAVIDNYDALTSDRPYRKAWTRESALSYIEEHAGQLFDPEVVTAFLKMM